MTLPRLSDEGGEIETEIGPYPLSQDCQRDFGVKRRPGDVLETRGQHDSFLDAAKVRYGQLCRGKEKIQTNFAFEGNNQEIKPIIAIQGDSRQLMETVRMLMLVATSCGFLAAFMA